MRIFCAIFFAYQALISLGELKTFRNGLFAVGVPWSLAGILSYLFSGLLLTIAFSLLLKPKWRRLAGLLAVICIAALSFAIVLKILGGGNGCKSCPSYAASSVDTLTLFFLLFLHIAVLIQSTFIFLGVPLCGNRGDTCHNPR